ncbi:MAG TPA: N-6 DNA methylase [Vicinamibacterales bacterium]
MLPGFGGHLISELFLERHILEGNAVRERAGDARRALIAWRRRTADLGPASSVRAMLETGAAPLVALLGGDTPSSIEPFDRGLSAIVRFDRAAVALVVTTWGAHLDPLWRSAIAAALRHAAAWSLLFNGSHLRIVDARRLYSKRFTEFDLDLAADDERAFAALWSIVRAEMFSAGTAGSPLDELVRASEGYASGVCRSLRNGVLMASTDVLAALTARRSRRAVPEIDAAFEQSLTIVYRLLFLLFAEARGLVPLWHPVYRESYSIEALRATAEQPHGATGLWDALRAIGRLAHGGCCAGDLRVTAFNGRLFAPSRTPLAERRDLDDDAARRAIVALSTRPAAGGGGRERIAYRDLGVEQLGAVYETLLDFEPRVASTTSSSRPAKTITLARGSVLRKETASFYTPQPLADYLVRRTLGPLTAAATPDRILQLRIVDPAMGSGAFLVAACRYLASEYESALVAAGGCHQADIGEPERAAIRRTIAERCLYGVDLNPTAVQLGRLSLWLATLAADRPLTFLDHRLVAGDSLLGASVANLRHAPRPAKRGAADALPLFPDAAAQAVVADALPVRFSFETVPDDTLEHVREKERALAALTARGSALSKWKRVADVWCAGWFTSSGDEVPWRAFSDLSDAILSTAGTLPPRTAATYLNAAERIAARRRFFHWELEFPEVFFDSAGIRRADRGFDAVIGNPPWDMLRADTGSSDRRDQSRGELSAVVRFTRESGVYGAQSDGHANRYQLFTERALALTRPGGRIGLVLPGGLGMDRGSAALRRMLLSRSDVDAIVGLDNRRGVFPIHRSVRFVLVTATAGSPTRTIACRFGEHDPASLEQIGDEPAATSAWFKIAITAPLLERISGDELTIPWLEQPTDLSISERAAALYPALGSAAGWRARFGRELNATDDKDAFRPVGRGLPIVAGKHLRPFQVDVTAAEQSIRPRDAAERLAGGAYLRQRLAYRDVASPTNRVTLIAAVLPAGCVSTHTVFCLRTPLPLRDQHFLCGVFNSLLINFLVRQRVSTHVTTAIVEQLPIPTWSQAPGACREIAALARVLARTNEPGIFGALNARVAALYQLTRAEFEHVLSAFPLIPREERDQCLKAFVSSEMRRPRK